MNLYKSEEKSKELGRILYYFSEISVVCGICQLHKNV